MLPPATGRMKTIPAFQKQKAGSRIQRLSTDKKVIINSIEFVKISEIRG
jgi:hypothetical protein